MELEDKTQLEEQREQKIHTLRRHEEEKRTEELARSLNLPYSDPSKIAVEPEALLLIPEDEAQKASSVVLRKTESRIVLATTNPNDKNFLALCGKLKAQRLEVAVTVVSKTNLDIILALYPKFSHLKKQITGELTIAHEQIEKFKQLIKHIKDAEQAIAATPQQHAGSLVEVLLASALKLGASDIHIEPLAETARIRFRLDGMLYDAGMLSRHAYALLRSRLKLLSGLKLNIENQGQDGRFSIAEDGQEIDVRTSTLPGASGEYIVMRLLNPHAILSISDLGLRRDLVEILEKELKRPNGMILTTGPTGSGKTTALYAFLKHIARPEIKIITIEDPIEYRIAGIEQTNIDTERGYDFTNGLRSILRQDPDIILVGEIRDRETAEIALHAALTGQLVFSTLHTNDAAGAVPRLIDLEVNPSIIAPAINVAVAQRLVRRLCKACGRLYRPEKEEFEKIQAARKLFPSKFALPLFDAATQLLGPGKGCEDCHFTGYRGRTGIFEIFRITKDVEGAILANPSIEALNELAQSQGMIPMQLDGLLKVFEQITSLAEIERVTGPLGEAS